MTEVDRVPSSQEERDLFFMRRAVQLGERGRRITAPNPWVGAIIVAKDGKTILGEGYHTGPGKAHGEVEAFRDAEAKGHTNFEGTTMYTTLEPCHRGPGKRTGPCDELLVAKKIKRCVMGYIDPCPKHGGKGVALLEEAGIEVTVGVAEEEVRSSFRCYLHHRNTERPYVVLKIATSLDGRIACADKTSQWITQGPAREDAHRLRADSQAILIGSGTALADKPSLTVRLPEDPGLKEQPVRVVLDTRGRVLDGPLLDTSKARTLIFTSKEHCSDEAKKRWQSCGIDVCEVPLEASSAESPTKRPRTDGAAESSPGLDLDVVLKELAKRGVLQLMVEGGAVLQGKLLQKGLCEELRVYLGATLLGSSAQPWAQTALTSTIKEAKFWQLRGLRRLGNDVCLEYENRPNEVAG
eukprot:TRINITY_DN5221_c0_g2_i1.p1 TRINITY_DN5221_c0_g2~~TRINITY_DN5221_c0_g2_i1.p1  ORF type:complete len:427 (-),score=91.44 TRINITY_DN5221_c0_g2_i1:647-1876(-)